MGDLNKAAQEQLPQDFGKLHEREIQVYGRSTAVSFILNYGGGQGSRYRTVAITTFPKRTGAPGYHREPGSSHIHRPTQSELWNLLAFVLGMQSAYIKSSGGKHLELKAQSGSYQLITTRPKQGARSIEIAPGELARIASLVLEAISENDQMSQESIIAIARTAYRVMRA